MTAMHPSSACTARSGRCAQVALMLVSASSFIFGGHALAQAPEPITAVYKAKEVSLHLRRSSPYSCHELQNRVANILLAIGARDDIDVDVRNCDPSMIPEDTTMDPSMDPSMDPMYGRDSRSTWDRWNSSSRYGELSDNRRQQAASVRIRVMMPVEVTPQVLAEIDKDKSRRELVSRVTGNPVAAMNDPIVFAAERQEVTLPNNSIRLRPEDCTLVDDMTSQVFRKLDVRVVNRSFSCGPRDSSRIPPRLTVETLLPTGALLPMPDPEKKTGAGASDDSAAETSEPKTETPRP